MDLTIPRLTGEFVVLEPCSIEHLDGLRAASADGEVWRTWYTRVPAPDTMAAEIDRRLALHARGDMVPWTTCDASGRPVGMTTFMNVDAVNRRVEIGSTWLGASAQGTRINPEAKLLQLTYAFEHLGCIAVEFRTNWHNRQSRAAIEKLGAKQDGVLRSHIVMPNGTLRDTVVYSILPVEWPAVRAGLLARLGRD